MDATVQLFCNASAGSHSARRIEALRGALQAQGARVILSANDGGAPQIDPAATHICAAGGDGTLRHVASALAASGRDLPIAVYPQGTINLVAREAGYPKDPSAFAARLLGQDAPRGHYGAHIGDTTFFACASIGPDSMAVELLSPALKRRIGRLAYGVALLSLLWRWPRRRLKLSIGDETIACEAVYIAKGRYFAGPWSFAPRAALTEPVLHVLALKRARRRDFLAFGWDLVAGRDPALRKGALAFECSALMLSTNDTGAIQADGDIVASLPVRIELREEAIAFR